MGKHRTDDGSTVSLWEGCLILTLGVVVVILATAIGLRLIFF